MYPSWQRSSDPVGPAEADDFLSPGRHDQIPIEGVGLVHVTTEVPDDDPGFAYTDVFVQTYRNGQLQSPVRLLSSVCERPFTLSMHSHWSEVERLCRCVRGDGDALCLQDIDWEIEAEPLQPEGTAPSEDADAPDVHSLLSRALRRDSLCNEIPTSA